MPASLRSATAHHLPPPAAWSATAVLAARQLRRVRLGVARISVHSKCNTPFDISLSDARTVPPYGAALSRPPYSAARNSPRSECALFAGSSRRATKHVAWSAAGRSNQLKVGG